MEALPQIPLAIVKKENSFLEKTPLLEYYPIERVNALINSDLLRVDWIENRYGVIKNYENEKHQLEEFLKIYDKKQQGFPVRYVKPKHKWGRPIVKNALGCTAFSKKIRNTLIKDLYYDFDLKNAQPEIIRNICKNNNISSPKINEYCENRNNILEEIAKKYNTTNTNAKKLMLRLCFFGSFDGWKEELNIEGEATLFIEELKNELYTIASAIQKRNKDLYETARQLKEAKKQKNFVGSMFALYLQEYEYRIVMKVAEYLIHNSTLMNHPKIKDGLNVGIYEYDGIKLFKENIDNTGISLDEVKKMLNEITLLQTGFELEWELKSIEDYYDIEPFYPKAPEEEPELKEEAIVLDGVWNDLDATETLYKLYPHWVFCQDTLFVFDEETGIWKSDHTSHLKVIRRFHFKLNILEKNSKGETYQTAKSYGNTLSLMEKIPPIMKTLCMNDNWLKEKECSSLGKMLFTNGYYDFREQKFYDKETYGFNPNILFMGRIHHDFEDFDMDYIADIKQRLFYNALGKDAGDYFLRILARGLAGDKQKRILFGLGGTNSGKTIITNAVSSSCGDYFGAFNAENLSHRQSNNDEAQVMRWAMLLRFKRLIFSNEIKTGAEINGNMLKKVASNGDPLIGRNHCKAEEEFTAHFLPVCFANDLPNIKPFDDAVDERVRVISFKKSFVSEPTNELELQANPLIKQEIDTIKFQKAFVGMLIWVYTFDNIEYEPIDVINGKEDWIQDDKNLIETFREDFEITNDANQYTPSRFIENWIKQKKLGISMKKFGIEMKKYSTIHNLKNVYSEVKKLGKNTRVWYGIRKLEDEEDIPIMEVIPQPPKLEEIYEEEKVIPDKDFSEFQNIINKKKDLKNNI